MLPPAVLDSDYWYEPHYMWPDYHAERSQQGRTAHLHVLQSMPIDERRLVFGTRRAALDYLIESITQDLRIRVNPGRATSFRLRMESIDAFYSHLERCRADPACIPSIYQHLTYAEYVSSWNDKQTVGRPDFRWSAEQREVLDARERGTDREDANVEVEQLLYVQGDPGAGKTEVLCEAAMRAAKKGL